MSATDKKREGRIKWECPFTEKKGKRKKLERDRRRKSPAEMLRVRKLDEPSIVVTVYFGPSADSTVKRTSTWEISFSIIYFNIFYNKKSLA